VQRTHEETHGRPEFLIPPFGGRTTYYVGLGALSDF
jgi:hypothetical protein